MTERIPWLESRAEVTKSSCYLFWSMSRSRALVDFVLRRRFEKKKSLKVSTAAVMIVGNGGGGPWPLLCTQYGIAPPSTACKMFSLSTARA